MDALLSPRRRRLVAALGAAALGAACGARPARTDQIRLGGRTMGSTFSVRVAGGPFAAGLEAAVRGAVEAAFDAVVARMSTYDGASELARFNRHAAATPFALSDDTLAVLARGRHVAALTGGAFDITVAPLVGAWGFGAGASARGAAPAAAALAAPVGWQRLAIDRDRGTVRKLAPGLQADLSGIAKGHAVDQAAQALDALGVDRYLVEAGGEIRTRGLNAEGRPWQIAIERPDAWPQRVHRIVPLQGLSMATSGDYRNYYEIDGRRICHEIDPATRSPIANRLASVTVIHEECMFADAMSTALIVLGLERGLALARAQRLAAFFIVREADGRLRDVASDAFTAIG